MKNYNIYVISVLTMLSLSACGGEAEESNTEILQNPVDTYLDSRVDAVGLAKKSLAESDKRNKEQNEQIKTLVE